MRAALGSAPVTPDAVIPPKVGGGETTDGKPTLLGPGWKKLVSGVVADKFVALAGTYIRSRGYEPADQDDDNVAALKDTLEATIHQFAPTVVVPWWVALPMAALFVFLDLRTAARKLEQKPEAPKVPQPTPTPEVAAAPDAPPAPAASSAAAEPAPVPVPAGPSRFRAVMPPA